VSEGTTTANQRIDRFEARWGRDIERLIKLIDRRYDTLDDRVRRLEGDTDDPRR
jgi:hypothetical protein